MRTGMRYKFDAPSQPDGSPERGGVVELVPGHRFEDALRDLEGFSRIWLVWWFHRNTRWRPLVLPPRGPARRRGVFATRSPHRPNPIGMTAVTLVSIQGSTLTVGSNDLIDGTPILDIKPYLPAVDAHPHESIGWLASIEDRKNAPRCTVAVAPLAEEQIVWLREEWRVDFISRASELLAIDPSPHRTRRIKQITDTISRMGCGGWRLYFSVEGDTVTIREVASGYPEHLLLDTKEYTAFFDREAQLAFRARWPNAGEVEEKR